MGGGRRWKSTEVDEMKSRTMRTIGKPTEKRSNTQRPMVTLRKITLPNLLKRIRMMILSLLCTKFLLFLWLCPLCFTEIQQAIPQLQESRVLIGNHISKDTQTYNQQKPKESPFQSDLFPKLPSGKHRMKVLQVFKTNETYFVDEIGKIYYFQNEIPFVSKFGWYDQEDVISVPKEEIYQYVLGDPAFIEPRIQKIRPQQEDHVKKNEAVCPCRPAYLPRNSSNLFTKTKEKIKQKPLTIPAINTRTIQYCFLNNSEVHEVISRLQLSSPAASALQFRLINDSIMIRNNSAISFDYIQEVENCDLFVIFRSPRSRRNSLAKIECPEKCLPVPIVSLSTSFLFQQQRRSKLNHHLPHHHKDSPPLHHPDELLITCSLTWKQLRSLMHPINSLLPSNSSAFSTQEQPPPPSPSLWLEFLLDIIYRRRLMECHEEHFWPKDLTYSPFFTEFLRSSSIVLPKRSVWGLILWIGSTSRSDLLHEQMRILQYFQSIPLHHHHHLNLHSHRRSYRNDSSEINEVIAGWGATEDQLPCSSSCGQGCHPITNDGQYRLYLPRTFLNQEQRPNGIKCGQYRPLRALAHTLLLYEPSFILLADDDTFVSARILSSPSFHQFVNGYLQEANEVFGELSAGDRDITRNGFIFGGGGYLFGKKVITRLNSHLFSPNIENEEDRQKPWAGSWMKKELQIVSQAFQWSQQKCPGCVRPLHRRHSPQEHQQHGVGNQLLMMINNSNESISSAIARVRVVDICRNMFSHEGSCFSSDHAISLCFAHGIYARLRLAPSTGHFTYGPMNYPISMSFDYLVCHTYRSLTCHRFKPTENNLAFARSIAEPDAEIVNEPPAATHS